MSIKITDLTKKYGRNIVLNSISLEIQEESIYGLLGRNGVGKSTLLNIISNRIVKTSGEVLVDGEPAEENEKAQQKIFLMSETNLYPNTMTGSEIIKWTKEFYPETDMTLALELAKKFSFDTNKKISSLSTGQRTIIKFIAAISSNAKYTFLDEPILGLDANHRELLYKTIIKEYAKNPRTIVVATHLIEEIAKVVENVVILHDCKIVVAESTENLLNKGYSVKGSLLDVEEFIKNKNCLGVEKIGGFAFAYLLDDKPETIDENMEITGLNLQKIFIELTGGEGLE